MLDISLAIWFGGVALSLGVLEVGGELFLGAVLAALAVLLASSGLLAVSWLRVAGFCC